MHAPQLREATQSMTSRATTLAQPAQTRSAATAQAWWLALIALTVILLAPLLIVDVPPLLDYPNHLARAFVLASLPQDPVIARFYAPHWSIIPNLGLDLITPPLIRILPVHVAGRLLIAAALLLPVAGTIAYNTALGGRWWSLGVGLFAYNACLLYGFLNFEIAIGLALLLAAAWQRDLTLLADLLRRHALAHGRVDRARRRELDQLLDQPAFGGHHRRRRKPPAFGERQLSVAFGDHVLHGDYDGAPPFEGTKEREVASVDDQIVFRRLRNEAQDALV